jgi:hypothetical protein
MAPEDADDLTVRVMQRLRQYHYRLSGKRAFEGREITLHAA